VRWPASLCAHRRAAEHRYGDRSSAVRIYRRCRPGTTLPSDKDLAEFFGLSSAEARLAAALLTGKTLAEIAANSGTRITTARTQLGSILRKVGAAQQSNLIRILSSTAIGSVSWPVGWLDVALEVLQFRLSFSGI
jgi:DNA-binding NarL/FixJ family response regulator